MDSFEPQSFYVSLDRLRIELAKNADHFELWNRLPTILYQEELQSLEKEKAIVKYTA